MIEQDLRWFPERIEVMETLYYFSGPLIFTNVVNYSTYLFNLIDDDDEHNMIYWATEISTNVLDRLKKGTISVRGAMGNSEVYRYVLNGNYEVKSVHKMDIHDIPLNQLPTPGFAIFPKDDRVSDI